MGEKRAYKARKPGGGRKKLKPEYDAGKNLKEQMAAVVALYGKDCSLQSIADALTLNPIKVEKLSLPLVCMNRMWRRRHRILLRSIEKHKTIKKPSSQPQILFNSLKHPLPRTYHIRKACTSRVQQIKKKLVLEQSGGEDTEQ